MLYPPGRIAAYFAYDDESLLSPYRSHAVHCFSGGHCFKTKLHGTPVFLLYYNSRPIQTTTCAHRKPLTALTLHWEPRDPDAKDGGRSGRERQQQCHAVR